MTRRLLKMSTFLLRLLIQLKIYLCSGTLTLYENQAFYEGISEVVDVIVRTGPPLTVDTLVHDTRDFAPKLV